MSKVNASLLTFMICLFGLTVFLEERGGSANGGVILFAGIAALAVYALKKDYPSDEE